MSTYRKLLPLATLLIVFSMPAIADVLKMEGGEASVVIMDNRPSRGMTQSQVMELYGEPALKNPPVGEPPISSWDYTAFSVFFEGNYVLHTVNHTQKDQNQ